MGSILALALLTTLQTNAVWIEGESPASANVKYQTGAPGHADFLSGEKWLTITLDTDKVAEAIPADGAILTYTFQSPAGHREVWHRQGWEDARAPFEWRIDNGPWTKITSNQPTTDMQELAPWNQVAWLKLGDSDLTGTDHKLEIKIPRPVDANGKPQRLMYGSDAFALTTQPFHPYGKWQPGQDPRSETDKAAEQNSFNVKDESNPQRQTIPMDGKWLIARDDEAVPALVATPMQAVPQNAVWTAIEVPGDKAEKRPDLAMAHRVWYKTKINIPAGQANRSYQLTFRQNSLNTTLLVNGKFCGFNKNPFVNWTCDITPAIHEGTNEVTVGIKDAWYGFEQDPTDLASIRKSWAIPSTFQNQGFLHLSYPVWGCFKSGLLLTPILTVGGRTFASDVFVKPSVAKKRLDAEITLKNDQNEPAEASVQLDAVDADTGQVAAAIATERITLLAGEEKTLQSGGAWANPTLWWPDRPKMYRLRTTVTTSKGIDVSETPFGFREWTWDGPNYRLNGMVWHGWAELNQGETPDKWLANYRAHGQRFQRMSGPTQNGSSVKWLNMPYDEALDWCDKNGVVIRRCGPLDGEAIGYMAIEENEALKKKHGTEINQELLNNVRDQIVAQVKGERNHPSVNIWSVENEWLYINTLNLYGGLMDQFEADMKRTIDAVMAVDPTRLAMTDGGSAGKGSILPVAGDHYVYTNNPWDYPALAYGNQPDGAGRGRWSWNGKQPRYAGEDFFASGINPADYAWIQGEEAFGGKSAAFRGEAKVQRMINEGYRWGGAFTAWHLWIGDEGSQFHDKYVANAERAVFVRQYDSSFGSGQTISRTLGVFNDSRYDDPLTVDWSLVFGGKAVQKGSKTVSVAPGTNQKFDISLTMPRMPTRSAGKLMLSLTAGGKPVFHDEKPLSVLPEPLFSVKVAVYDPGGTVAKYLKGAGMPVTSLSSLASLPASTDVLLIGPNALTQAQSTDPALSAYALGGHRVIVLEQAHPLKYQALPVPLEVDDHSGAFGFPEDATSPVLKGLEESDFVAWGKEGRLYTASYIKPAASAKSLVETGVRLTRTVLTEIPVGKGVMLLSQLEVGANLQGSTVARTLLSNLLHYASTYKVIEHPVLSAVSDAHLAAALDGLGVRRTEVEDPIKAISGPAGSVAVVSATPVNLHKLAVDIAKVRAFTQAGGSLVLNGLTPEGLADYNKLVGVEHMIRPFRQEKTSLVSPKDPLTLGMTQGDVVMYSGQKMFDFNDDRFVADDIFSYIVDTDDVAPFAKLPSDYFNNTVNGFVSSDGWKYIFSFELNKGAAPEYTMEFPRPQTIKELTWVGNGFYHKVTKIALSFDGRPPIAFDVQPNTDPQTLTISPAQTAKSVKLSIIDWTHEPDMGNVVGIDNIYMKVARPAGWESKVKPMLNIGGLVHYPQGAGNIVLANLLFKDREAVPENAKKKRAILGAILRNLHAQFSGGSATIIAGAQGIEYKSISLADKANAFRNERGWFGDSKQTLAELPTGHQTFGNVPFDVYEFATSPVPTAVMLGGPGVPGSLADHVDGVPVNQKANALFFLQTARLDSRRDERESREGKKYVMAEYVITYADGQTATAPIVAEYDIDDFRQKAPHDLPGARVGWSKPFTSGDGSATAYIMQWTNPRPEVAIASIGLHYGKDRRGIPVLLAVTLAR